MFAGLADLSPLRQIVRLLLLHVHLAVDTRGAVDVLNNWVLDLDVSDLVVQRGEGIDPVTQARQY